MNCRTCGYTLFNLTEPRCPECNTPFDVTNYTFRPGTVRFACPTCGESYEGDDAQGLPAKREFPCAKCSKPLSVSAMRVVPMTSLAAGTLTRPVAVPWEEPGQMGLVRRWWKTVMFACRDPVRFYRVLRHVDDAKIAMKFAVICIIVCAIWLGLYMTVVKLDADAARRLATPVPLRVPLPGFLSTAFRMTAINVIRMTAVTIPLVLSVQVGVLVFAGDPRPFSSTIVIICYSMAPTVLGWIPLIGFVIFLVPYLVVEGVMVIHRTTTWRALAACLSGVVFLLGALFGLIILSM